MKASIILSAAVLFTSATAGGPIVELGCYKSFAGTSLNATSEKNSRGYCGTDICTGMGTFATQGGSCYCGDAKPMSADKIDDLECNLSCPAFPADNCGGKAAYFFYDNGVLNNIPEVAASSSTTSSTTTAPTSTTAATTTSTSSIATNTASASASATNKPSSKPNVAGIAAGVVIGVLAIAGIMGGLFFFMRSRKRRAIEEEHRRNASINSAKPPINSAATSFNDTRLDPVMAHRRMSDGSIADNQDYSRRILKVTNA